MSTTYPTQKRRERGKGENVITEELFELTGSRCIILRNVFVMKFQNSISKRKVEKPIPIKNVIKEKYLEQRLQLMFTQVFL